MVRRLQSIFFGVSWAAFCRAVLIFSLYLLRYTQEAELAEKSARLTELNTELDNEERNRGKKPEKDSAESGSQENRVAESSGWDDTGAREGKKPSILNELRQYERPAAASTVAERGKNNREVI